MISRTGFCLPALFAATAVAAPHRYDHVVIVIEEYHAQTQVVGNRGEGPFLIAAGATFSGYSEDVFDIGDRDKTGTSSDSNGFTYPRYRRKHNPWANWQVAFDEAEGTNQLAQATNRRLVDFPADFSLLPDIAFIVPNEQKNIHDGTILMGEDWLRLHPKSYAEWSRAHNSLFILTFDEYNSIGKNQIPTIMVGARLPPGRVDTTRWTPPNLLRTLGEMRGAAHTGRSAQMHPLTGIFPGDPPVSTGRFIQGINDYTDCRDTTVQPLLPYAYEFN